MEDLKYRWFLFNIKDNGNFIYTIEADDCVFCYNPRLSSSVEMEKMIDNYHDQKMYEAELGKRYPNLKFNKIDVYVKNNNVFTGYTMDPDDKEMFNKLKTLNDECQLIVDQPEKYTLCASCKSVVPKDYVAQKMFGGVVCKYCEATNNLKNKDYKWNN